MAPQHRRALWLMLGVGTLVRLVWAFKTFGLPFDVGGVYLTRDALHASHFHVYSAVNCAGCFPVWPYPPGFFAVIWVASKLSSFTGWSFDGLFQTPTILADAAIAWFVHYLLGRRGAADRTRLLAAALVAFGPVFITISGYHGQMDALAILPAVAAYAVWTQTDRHRTALATGLLIGIGAAIKTVPIVMVLALLPSARSRRDGLTMAITAVAVPLLVVAPFFIADPHGVIRSLRYRGAPGLGGLSLIAQPGLAKTLIVTLQSVRLSTLSQALVDYGFLLPLVALAACTVLLFRRRVEPLDACILLWLVMWVCGINFFIQYLIWGMPFLLIAGYLRQVAALQAAMVVPMVLLYERPWHHQEWTGAVYFVLMAGLWLTLAIALARLTWAIIRSPGAPTRRAQDPAAGAQQLRLS